MHRDPFVYIHNVPVFMRKVQSRHLLLLGDLCAEDPLGTEPNGVESKAPIDGEAEEMGLLLDLDPCQ